MSQKEPTYAETVTRVTQLQKDILEIKTAAAKKHGTDEDNDKEMEASFKKAQSEMNNDDKDHKATMDDHEKMKDAFKQANDETDHDKKHLAMKRAMEMKHDHDAKKHAKKAEEHPKEDVDDQPQKEAAITEIVMKKIPLMNKILEATRIVNPQGADKYEKFLTASTLEVVQDEYEKLAPFLAVVGLGSHKSASPLNHGMIPFQAASVLETVNTTNILTASVDEIDFTKVSTKDIMEMQQ